MKNLIKPNALKPGDAVATVSLSWGGAGLLSGRYEQGKKQFENAFGVKIIEMKNTLKSPDELENSPELRLADFMDALQNPEVKAILTNIGGDDTIRLLRYMTSEHWDIIKNNPKIFMGMSDTTANHFMFFKAGVSSFYSAPTMYGYAENGGIPEYMVENTKKTLFGGDPIGVLPESTEFIIDHLDWSDDETNKILRSRTKTTPWRYIQGNKIVRGRLLGGCLELLNMIMNGTSIWPKAEDWDNTILFIETSEEKLPPPYILWMLRNLGAQGILERINGILFARPGGEFDNGQETERDKWISEYPKFDDVILQACKEYDCTDIPIVTNMDFGHTVPQLILPIGVMTEINPIAKTVSILESAVR
jgi:muramoyltetrapeptide carboxypeptidase LdcA involved in peptidoglycan recycling